MVWQHCCYYHACRDLLFLTSRPLLDFRSPHRAQTCRQVLSFFEDFRLAVFLPRGWMSLREGLAFRVKRWSVLLLRRPISCKTARRAALPSPSPVADHSELFMRMPTPCELGRACRFVLLLFGEGTGRQSRHRYGHLVFLPHQLHGRVTFQNLECQYVDAAPTSHRFEALHYALGWCGLDMDERGQDWRATSISGQKET